MTSIGLIGRVRNAVSERVLNRFDVCIAIRDIYEVTGKKMCEI
jgi:hypothetical protein